MADNSELLTRISNDVEALIEMVGDLQKQKAGESLANQMKFRRAQHAYTQPVRAYYVARNGVASGAG